MTRLTRVVCGTIASVAGPRVAYAHAGSPPAPHDLWTSWSLDPWIVLPLALAAWAYARGVRTMRRRTPDPRGLPRWRIAAFGTGIGLLAIALVSPLDAMGSALFSAHMTQHEVMIVLAAPLLVLGRPIVPVLWALPPAGRKAIGGWARRRLATAWRILTIPAVAFVVHAAAVLVWHVPAFYQATLTNDAVHAAQHASFLGSAVAFWWSMLGGGRVRRARYGAAVLCLFGTALYGSALGALLAFAEAPWYPAYGSWPLVWGLTPLQDQQLGGLIMWIPAGLVHLPTALCFVALWARLWEPERVPRLSRQAA